MMPNLLTEIREKVGSNDINTFNNVDLMLLSCAIILILCSFNKDLHLYPID